MAGRGTGGDGGGPSADFGGISIGVDGRPSAMIGGSPRASAPRIAVSVPSSAMTLILRACNSLTIPISSGRFCGRAETSTTTGRLTK